MKWLSFVLLGIAANGCTMAKPACAVIDIADKACDFYVVQYVDESGGVVTEKVPKAELRNVALRVKARREGK